MENILNQVQQHAKETAEVLTLKFEQFSEIAKQQTTHFVSGFTIADPNTLDANKPQTILEISVLAVFIGCSLHSLLAHRGKSFWISLPFVIFTHKLLDFFSKESTLDHPEPLVYSKTDFTVLYNGFPIYVYLMKAILLYICDACTNLTYNCGLFSSTAVATLLAFLVSLPIEFAGVLNGFWKYSPDLIPQNSFIWCGVPIFITTSFWIILQSSFSLGISMVQEIIPKKSTGGISTFFFALLMLFLQAVFFLAGCIGITALQIQLASFKINEVFVLFLVVVSLLLFGGIIASKSKRTASDISCMFPTLVVSLLSGNLVRFLNNQCNNPLKTNEMICTPQGSLSFYTSLGFASVMFFIPLIVGKRTPRVKEANVQTNRNQNQNQNHQQNPSNKEKLQSNSKASTSETSKCSKAKPPKDQ